MQGCALLGYRGFDRISPNRFYAECSAVNWLMLALTPRPVGALPNYT
jgi:hypothetical protein